MYARVHSIFIQVSNIILDIIVEIMFGYNECVHCGIGFLLVNGLNARAWTFNHTMCMLTRSSKNAEPKNCAETGEIRVCARHSMKMRSNRNNWAKIPNIRHRHFAAVNATDFIAPKWNKTDEWPNENYFLSRKMINWNECKLDTHTFISINPYHATPKCVVCKRESSVHPLECFSSYVAMFDAHPKNKIKIKIKNATAEIAECAYAVIKQYAYSNQ